MLDLISKSDIKVIVALSTGANFVTTTVAQTAPATFRVLVGDLDGDTNPDIVLIGYAPWKFLKGDGHGNFVESTALHLPASPQVLTTCS